MTFTASSVALRSGLRMPLFGLGTWLAKDGGEAASAVVAAAKMGYRLIDTAAMYENESDIGAAIRQLAESGISRQDLFVVTKLHSSDHGDGTIAGLKTSLQKLGLERVDLYLVHSPNGGQILKTWDAMLELKRLGLARAVGVSNFGIEQLKALKAAGKEMPEVNQIELHFALQQRETVEYCRAEGIVVMGFCPLARCRFFGKPGVLADIAASHGVSEAQVALRWSVQQGIVTIPKSSNVARIEQNAKALDFVLSAAEMEALAQLDQGLKVSKASDAMEVPWEQVA